MQMAVAKRSFHLVIGRTSNSQNMAKTETKKKELSLTGRTRPDHLNFPCQKSTILFSMLFIFNLKIV